MFLPSREGGDRCIYHLVGGILGEVKHAVGIRGGPEFFLAMTIGEVFVDMTFKVSLDGCKEGEERIL